MMSPIRFFLHAVGEHEFHGEQDGQPRPEIRGRGEECCDARECAERQGDRSLEMQR